MNLFSFGQAYIGFMHESGALESVAETFLAQALMCQAAQIGIDQRHQGLQRFGVARLPLDQ
jgi:hypothetical protein